jgi:transposase-like protein
MVERRKYSAEFKVKVILELIAGQKGLAQSSREYGIKDSVISRWKQEFLERAPMVFENPRKEDPEERRVAELERTIGRMAVELDIAKKVFGNSVYRSRDDE